MNRFETAVGSELPSASISAVERSALAHHAAQARVEVSDAYHREASLVGKLTAHVRSPSTPSMLYQKDFQPEPRSARAVRQFVSEALGGSTQLDDVVLTASELASNVIRHAHTPYTVRIEHRETLVRLEISDGSSIVPAVEGLSDSQRGLRLVTAASDSWGIERTGNGKTIWAEFNTP